MTALLALSDLSRIARHPFVRVSGREGRSLFGAWALLVTFGLMVPTVSQADHHLESDDLPSRAEVQETASAVATADGEGEGFDAAADAETPHAEEGHDGEHDAGHGGGHGEDSGPLGFKADLSLWSLIIFLGFAALLAKLCWQPLMDGLNQREQNIRGAVEAAESARDEAASLLAEHKARMAGVDDEVKEIIAEARRDAERTKADIIAKANDEAEAARERSLSDIERAKQQALVELAARERDLVVDATESVLGRAIGEDDRQRLIDEALSQFASRN